MGFVKTPDEVARIRAVLRQPRFVASEMLMVEYLTRPQAIAAVLPPGFEPVSEPTVTAMVGRWRSNCVGDYCGGAIYVPARYKGIEAPYVLAMYMDTDPAIMFGRDVFGEPKKRASSNLHHRGNAMHGYVERLGVRLIDIHAVLEKDLGPGEASGANFNIKATPSADGASCEDDAVVTLAEFDNVLSVRREGTAALALGSSIHDPVSELEIVKVLTASYVEGDLIARAKAIGRIPKDAFFPYLLGRMDDWSRLDTEHNIDVKRVAAEAVGSVDVKSALAAAGRA
jgi:acetoacetate decarboxylase